MRTFALLSLLIAGSTTAAAQTSETLTLRQALISALAQSPKLRPADEAKERAVIRSKQNDDAFGLKATPSLTTGDDPFGNPQRTLGLGLSKRIWTGADVQLNATSYRYGRQSELRDSGYALNISQPLFRGFGATTAAERALARRGVATAERAALETRHLVIVTTLEAFLGVMRQRHQLDNSKRALERARRLRTSSEARARIGLATELDVLRAELLGARAESALASAEEQLQTAMDALKIAIGRGFDGDLDVLEEDLSDGALQAAGLAPDAAMLAGSAAEVMTRLSRSALAVRVDLLEARDRVVDARRSESIARWHLLPQTAMTVTYTRRGLWSSTDLFGPLLNGWRFGFSSTYALDRSSERSTAAMASLSVRSAIDEADEIEHRVTAEVRQAYRSWQRSAATVEIQQKSVAIAQKQLRLAELRYERGIAGNFDVVDAEASVFQAESDFESARIDRALAALHLRRVSGQLDPARFQP